MAQYRNSGLKRSIIGGGPMLVLLKNLEPRSFEPFITVSYIEYEDTGNYDSRVLFFSVSNYNNRLHKREIRTRVAIPLCLLLDFINMFRKYDQNDGNTRELGMLQEFPGSAFRTIVFQEKDNLLLRRQSLRDAWTNSAVVCLNNGQLKVLKIFLDRFKSSHLTQIIKSKRRRNQKQSSWEQTPRR